MNEVDLIPDRKIRIIPATWRDLMELHELEKVCFQLDAWPLIDVLGVLTFPQIIRLKAVEDLKMVGFIAADLRRAQQVAWIATLAVDPHQRKTGIGSALLSACEGKINLPKIRLSVRQSNQPAIDLYQNRGYQQVDVWKSYYKGGDNALIFEKMMAG